MASDLVTKFGVDMDNLILGAKDSLLRRDEQFSHKNNWNDVATLFDLERDELEHLDWK